MLIPPADAVPEFYAAQMQNWRVDRGGQIKTRRGLLADGTGIAGGKLHTLYRSGTDRYGGVGTLLKSGAALAGSVDSGFDGEPLGMASAFDYTWVMNRAKQRKVEGSNSTKWGIAAPASACTAAIGAHTSVTVSEFDSGGGWDLVFNQDSVETVEPSFRVDYYTQGVVQIANGASSAAGENVDWGATGADIQAGMVLRIDDGTSVYRMTISTIPTIDTLTLGSAYGGVTGEYAYAIESTTAAKTYDSSNKKSGTHSTHIQANPAGIWSLSKTFAATDYGFSGQDRDDDIFYWWLYASDSAAITNVTVTWTDSAGAMAQCRFSGSILSQSPFSWNQMAMFRRLDAAAIVGGDPVYQAILTRLNEAEAAGNTVDFEAAKQAQENQYNEILARTPHFQEAVGKTAFNWAQVTGLQFDFDCAEACDIHLDLAEWYGAGGAISGEFTFYVTFANDAGHESNPSSGSGAIVLKKQKADLSAIPVSADAQVTMRHIYGIGNALEAPKRFSTIANNTATTLTLNVSLDTITDENTDMPTRNGLPPAARGVIQHMGRLVAFDSDAHPARSWWTDIAKPFAFYGADDDVIGDWRDNGEADERILTATSRANMLLLYKQRSIWRIVGDIGDTRTVPERAAAKMGPVGPQAVAAAPGYDYVATEEGIFRFNGDSASEITGQLKPIFQSETVELPGATVIQPWNRTAAAVCVMAYSNGRLYFSYPEAGQTENNASLCYDEATQVWAIFKNGSSVASAGFSSLNHEGTGNGLIGGVTGGGSAAVYGVEIGAVDGGGAIPVLYQTPEWDGGVSDQDKRLCEIAVEHRTAEQAQTPSALTLKVVSADGTITNIGSLVSATPTRQVFAVGSNGAGLLSRGWSVRLEGNVSATCTVTAIDLYWLLEARARLSFDSDVLSFCYLQDLEGFDVRLTSNALVNWAVFSDSSGSLVQVATGTLASTAGERGTLPIALSGVTGKNFRLRLWGAAFQLHDLRARLRELGEFIDGFSGGFWETTDKALGDFFEKNWLYRRFTMDSDANGAMNIKWSTELPGRNMAQRQANVFNTELTTVGRATIEGAFPGTMQGFLKRIRVDGGSRVSLYGIKVYARPLGWGDGQWRWVEIPMRKGEDIARCVEVALG